MRIIITEKIAEESVEFLRKRGFEVDEKLGFSQSEIEDMMGPYDAIIVRSVTQVNESLLSKAPELKVVGRAGNGIDNIDVNACTKRGIIAVNTPEANIMAAGELAVGLAFAVFRNIAEADQRARKDDFRRATMIGNELDGKTAGIIGLGRIGSIVARKLAGVGMDVVAYDPYVTEEKFKKLGVKRCEKLDDLLVAADLISFHTPKNKETYNMLDSAGLAKCKKGVRIVNAARGGLVNEQALYDSLVSGHVAGAGIDVFDKEPGYDKKPGEQNYQHPLLTLPNCVVTPHLGASTHEANSNVGTAVTELVARALEGELVAAINMPSVSGRMSEMAPYIELAEKLGSIYYQAEKARVNKIELVFRGDLAANDTGLVTLAALKGFLSPISHERISYVNVKQNVKDMGVEVVESKSSHLEKYTNLLTIKFYSDEKELAVSGTVFAKDMIRLVDFFGYHMDFEPAPNVIAMQNVDIPGIIGKVGTVLGTKDINITAMNWSSKKEKQKAVSFVSVEKDVDQDTVNALLAVDGVLRVSVLHF
ncbi:phosphoglycerate dehydrogenase [Candidatus Nomurabacteria bacterium]|nr:phosphoglycerate dehydrogenase [Candidatus Nomurabacteria bacterium]